MLLRRRMPTLLALALVCWLATAPPAAAVGVRPVDGPVARGFDPPRLPWLRGHRGVDLRASPGTPVRAAASGRVGFAGVVAGKPVVTVVHGALRTTYEPVRALVRAGQVVAAGEVIGRLVAGHGCGADQCLHWGLRRGDTYLDPLFHGAIEATEEAVVNALLAAETMTGRDGITAHALD
ncbi:MAG: peptidoglycan DD-metalloendopeptidase family protein, partial [Propionicimonas sp.]|nr:peptidoglycan DD-metalloendopeptidase family protein [Propionicimonas sp.]